MIRFEKGQIILEDDDLGHRTFRSFALKSFLSEISKLVLLSEKKAAFCEIEKKAIKKYFLFLLSRKDYLSSELIKKGKLCGFDEQLCHLITQDFEEKKWINNKATLEKKALKKIKKGYALHQFPEVDQKREEARLLEKETLQKLLKKKIHLFESKEVKDRQKGYRFFLSRGYSISQINDELASVGVNFKYGR